MQIERDSLPESEPMSGEARFDSRPPGRRTTPGGDNLKLQDAPKAQMIRPTPSSKPTIPSGGRNERMLQKGIRIANVSTGSEPEIVTFEPTRKHAMEDNTVALLSTRRRGPNRFGRAREGPGHPVGDRAGVPRVNCSYKRYAELSECGRNSPNGHFPARRAHLSHAKRVVHIGVKPALGATALGTTANACERHRPQNGALSAVPCCQ